MNKTCEKEIHDKQNHLQTSEIFPILQVSCPFLLQFHSKLM